MYKILENINYKKLINKHVQQIAFSINTISLYLEECVFITLYGDFSFTYGEKIHTCKEIYPLEEDFELLLLLEKRITQYKINERKNKLTLEFEGGFRLELNSNEMYESFIINLDGETIIV